MYKSTNPFVTPTLNTRLYCDFLASKLCTNIRLEIDIKVHNILMKEVLHELISKVPKIP